VDFVVRFNGGGQAAHNVVTPEGVHHTFAHFGSGTLAGKSTVLSRFMVINPLGLQREAQALAEKGVSDPRSGLYIDARAMLTLPPHVGLLKSREARRGDDRHGSTNFGLAEVMRFSLEHPDEVIRVGDLFCDPQDFIDKYLVLERWSRLQDDQNPAADYSPLFLSSVKQRWAELQAALDGAHVLQPDEMGQLLGSTENLLFEGAQGVLLDEWRGFHPYTTWSTTTFDNVFTLLSEWGNPQPVKKLGILRAYHTRHGYGPFPTYQPEVTLRFMEPHNSSEAGMGRFRAGHFDLVMARYAIEVCGGVDALALTHMDRAEEVKVCTRYGQEWGMPIESLRVNPVKTDLAEQRHLTKELFEVTPDYRGWESFAQWYGEEGFEDTFDLNVVVESYGPTASDKKATGIALDTPAVGY
jgi:adenylosuccinate synthase